MKFLDNILLHFTIVVFVNPKLLFEHLFVIIMVHLNEKTFFVGE